MPSIVVLAGYYSMAFVQGGPVNIELSLYSGAYVGQIFSACACLMGVQGNWMDMQLRAGRLEYLQNTMNFDFNLKYKSAIWCKLSCLS